MTRLLLPDYFSLDDYEKIVKALPGIAVTRIKVVTKKGPFSKGFTLSLDEKPHPGGSLDDVKICIVPNGLSKEGVAYLVEQCPALEWIHSTATGVEHLMIPEIKRRNIPVTHSHLCSEAMAEYVLAVILCTAKRIIDHRSLQEKGVWKFLPSTMLSGKKACILGIGHVGQAIARRLKQNGLEVWAMGRSEGKQIPNVDRYATLASLSSFIGECDFIVLALPLTDLTYHCLNIDALATMKKTAWIINIGRGELIDTPALLAALRTGQIGGACLDVVEQSLQDRIRSLGKYRNLILTHHSSFSYPGYSDDILEILMDELKRYKAGQNLKNLVDINKGY